MPLESRSTRSSLFPPGRLAIRGAALLTCSLLVALGSAIPAAASPSASAGDAMTASTPAPADFTDGRYIVTLRDPSVATYGGGLDGFAGTRARAGKSLDPDSRRAKSYAKHLENVQESVAHSVDADVVSAYTLTTNGFSSSLTAKQASTLADNPRVASVVPDQKLQLDDPVSPQEFLGLDGDQGVWEALGGVAKAGKGVVVGVIDTGIAPENPSFAGAPLGTSAGEEPYRDGEQIVFAKGDGTDFRGVCATGVQFTADDCSTKIVGARYFVENFGTSAIGSPSTGEYLSPRDGASHGSHTASTAVGNHAIEAKVGGKDFGAISGVAPAAKVAAYKVCWSGPDPTAGYDDGCQTSDILAAIDAAVADNVDVINYSIGQGAATTTVSLTDQAFFGAAAAGIFVAAAAGNDGEDGASTADNASPWITTVAASTVPTHDATVRFGDGRAFIGASITVPEAGFSGPFVTAQSVAAPDSSQPQLCGPDTLDPTKAAGKIVLCVRGEVSRLLKSAEVARVGGIGMVLVNSSPSSLDLDAHAIPAISLNADAFQAATAYAQTAGATVTLQLGNTTDHPSAPSPQVAGFSSRGPTLADGSDVLKPDIAAPGVAILAAGANAQGKSGTWEFMSGTSMASPHIAGLAALYLGAHPKASPAEIKSAMMTTAYDTLDATGKPMRDPFAQGAGHVDPTRYFEPGLLYLNGAEDWLAYTDALGYSHTGGTVVDPSDLNLASIAIGSLAGTQTVTRTVTSTGAGTFEAQPVAMNGIAVTVTPSMLTFAAAGETKQYQVTFTRTDAPLDAFTTGYLDWANGSQTVRSPLAVRPISLSAPAEVTGAGSAGSAAIDVLGGEDAEFAVSTAGLARGQVVRGVGKKSEEMQAFIVDVPRTADFVRFDVDSTDSGADLALSVENILEDNVPDLMGVANSGAAHERLEFAGKGLPLGRYIIGVWILAGSGDVHFTLTSHVVDPTAGVGGFSVDPKTVRTSIGTKSTVTASWSGLQPGGSYLGRVQLGENGPTTTVAVTSDAGSVSPSTDRVVTVSPDPIRPGDGTTVSAQGFTPGDEYAIYQDDDTEPILSGIVSDDGELWRYVKTSATTTYGTHRLDVRTTSGAAHADFEVVQTVAFGINEFIKNTFDGSPTAMLDVTFIGSGTLRVRLESADGKVYHDESAYTVSPEGMTSYTYRQKAIELKPGSYVATLWVVSADGEMTQKKHKEFVVGAGVASRVTFSPSSSAVNAVDYVLTNNSRWPMEPRLEYKSCTGVRIYANEFGPEGPDANGSVTAKTFDLTAISSVSVTVDGKVVGRYRNQSPTACAGTPNISQDLWVTVKPTPVGAAMRDAGAKPLTMTVSNRVDLYSDSFNLDAGVGTESLETEPFFTATVLTERLDTTGPVLDRDFQVDEKVPTWIRVQYIQHGPQLALMKRRLAFAPALTVADVTAAAAVGDPVTPGGTSPSPAGGLANTGASVIVPISLAVLLIMSGGVFLALRRIRRRTT